MYNFFKLEKGCMYVVIRNIAINSSSRFLNLLTPLLLLSGHPKVNNGQINYILMFIIICTFFVCVCVFELRIKLKSIHKSLNVISI